MPVPHVQIHLDLDEDGVFESGEDVTADVRSFSIQRGKEVSQQRAAAAQLDLTLNNLNHKYSPANINSALYPFTLPGPYARVRMGWPYDSFTGSNGTTLHNRTPDVGSELGNWTMTGPGGLEILSNEMTINAIGAHYGTLDYGLPDVILAAKVHRPTITSYPYTQSIFVFRYADTDNWAQVRMEQTTSSSPVRLQLQNKVSGSTDAAAAIISDVTVWPEDDYADITCLVKGDRVEVVIGAIGNQAGVLNTVDSALSANTKHGIGGPDYTTDSPNGGATWDDFGLYTHFVGRVDRVEPRINNSDVSAFVQAYDDMERLNLNVLFTGTTDLLPASSGDIANRILTRAGYAGGSIVDTGTDPITPTQVDTGNNQAGVPVTTGTVMGGSALTEMQQIADDEVGFFYVDKHGIARFEDSDHRESNDHTEAVGTWRDIDGQSTATIREPFEWDDGIERVENQVYYEYFRLAKTVSTTVWFLEPDDDPQFTTGRTHPDTSSKLIVDIAAIGEDLAISSPKIPLPGTDYSVDENADGTGQDWLTAIVSETAGTVTLTGSPNYEIDDTLRDWAVDGNTIAGIVWTSSGNVIVMQDASGNTAVGTITLAGDPDGDGTRAVVSSWPEAATATPGYISMDPDFDETDTPITYDVYVVAAFVLDGFEGNYQFLRFFGDATMDNGSISTLPYVTSAKLQADKLSGSVPASPRAEDSTSQATHGLRRVRHTTKHIRDWDTAMNRAEKRVALRKDPRERIICHMRPSSPENIMEIMFREVSDRVTIEYSDMALDRDYFIENYRFTWTQNGIIETRWEATRSDATETKHYRYGDADAKYGTATFS